MQNSFSEKTITRRLTAFLLAVLTFFTVLLPDSIGIGMIRADADDGGFIIKLSWNDHIPEDSYTYISSSDERQVVRLKISYENKNVSGGGYAPGSIFITVPGISGAFRTGPSLHASIAADAAGSSPLLHEWSYSYSSETGMYTFTNNSAIMDGETFEGSFEIMWQVPSRTTFNDYYQTLQAELITSSGARTQSNAITYSQQRTPDEYTLNMTAYQVYQDDIPLQNYDYRNYVWVRYNVSGTDTYLARDVNGVERFECWFLDGAQVINSSLSMTDETDNIGGKTYRKYIFYKNINPYTPNPYISDIFVGYPNELKNEAVTAYTRLYGTYLDDISETELAQAEITVNLPEYALITIPAGLYFYSKKAHDVHGSIINSHDKQCYDYGAVNASNLRDGKGVYYSDLYVGVNNTISAFGACDLEVTDDFLAVTTTDGGIRLLGDDEYNFTEVYIPSRYELLNSNGFPISGYPVDVYYFRGNMGADGRNQPILAEHTSVGESGQTISLPDDAIAVRIIIRGVNESIGFYANSFAAARCFFVILRE